MNSEGRPDVKVRVLKLTNRLIKKLGIRDHSDEPGFIDPAAIEEADRLVDALAAECPQAIAGYLDKLSELWLKMRDMPRSDEREDISQQIFHVAHEIKDLGAMSGYELMAYFAESLRDYIGRTELNLEAQRVIIQEHVDALQVVHKQDMKEAATPEAEELKKMVKIAIDKYS